MRQEHGETPAKTARFGQDVAHLEFLNMETCISPHHTPTATMLSLLNCLGLVLLFGQAQALYFYIDGPSQKCFFEE